MTEAERRAWDAAHAREAANAPKKKWRFLQKYWHKGAFFQDASDSAAVGAGGDTIFQRDFSAPTGEDKLDKTVLPKVRYLVIYPSLQGLYQPFVVAASC